MTKYEYNGKTKEEAIEQALKDLNLSENNIIVNVLEALLDMILPEGWDNQNGL